MVNKRAIYHKYPLVTIEWADHHATQINEPHSIDELVAMAPPIRQTSGYLVYEGPVKGSKMHVVIVCKTIEEDLTITECDIIMKKGIMYRSDRE